MVGGATPLHPSIINPTIPEHLEDTGFFSLKALGSKKWQLLHLPFNRAGSHLPSWNSKLLGREWGGEEGHTHTHTTHTLLTLTSVFGSCLCLETSFQGADLKLGVLSDQLPIHTEEKWAWPSKGAPSFPPAALAAANPTPAAAAQNLHTRVCARTCACVCVCSFYCSLYFGVWTKFFTRIWG